jgi:PAS domain S-box-containing protein
MDEIANTPHPLNSQAWSPREKIAACIPGIVFQFLQRQDGFQSLLYISSGCKQLCELEPQVVQKDFRILYKLLHPEDAKAFIESVARARVSAQTWRWEGRIITFSGQLKWIEGCSHPEKQANGDIIWEGVLIDITDRKIAQQKWQETELCYRAILDAIPDLVLRISCSGEYLDCKGNTGAEVIGKNVQDLLPSDVASIYQEAIAETLASGKLQTREYQLLTPSGIKNYQARLIKSGKDEVLVIVRDITEWKQTKLALQTLDQRGTPKICAIQQIFGDPDQKFALAFRCSPNPITISTLQEGRYIDVNDSFVQLSGYERWEAVGRTALELNIWANPSDRIKFLQNLQRQGAIRNQEFAFRKKSGQIILVQVSAEIIHLDGTPCLLAVSQDITERKQTELALRKSEEKFSKAFYSSLIAIAILRLKDGCYLDVNDAFVQMTGFSREEVIGRSSKQLNIWMHPAHGDTITKKLQQQGSIRNLETVFFTKSGRCYFLAESITITGQASMLWVVYDITERKRAEKLLRLSAGRDRLLAQTLVQIRNSLDLEQILQTTVNEVRQFLQVDRVFIIVNTCNTRFRIVAESTDPKYPAIVGCKNNFHRGDWQQLQTLLLSEQVRVIEDITQIQPSPQIAAVWEKFQTKAILAVPIMVGKELFGALIANSCSKPRTWQAMDIDLLQQLSQQLGIAIQQARLYKQLAQLNANLEHQVQQRTTQLQQKIQQLQEIHQIKDVVLHTISHDLRTCVVGNLMVLQNLLKNQEINSQSKDAQSLVATDGIQNLEEISGVLPCSYPLVSTSYSFATTAAGNSCCASSSLICVPRSTIERMIQGNDRQLRMIDSLLEIHSSKTQGVILNKEVIPFHTLAEAIFKDIEPMLKHNQACCHKSLPQDFPLVFADPIQLQKVFVNLVTHSLQKNPPGLKLKISAQVEAQMIRFTIQDNGVPLNKLECDRFFELQIQKPQARCSADTSLQMYICKQIIKAHGGEIGVISNRKQGVTFWFTLPLAIPSLAERKNY